MKKLGIILALVIIAVMVLPAIGYAAGPASVQVPADVEILKKGTLNAKNVPWMYDPLAARRPTSGPKQMAATGILGAPVTGDRYAIVIGISDYPGADMDLKYAANDANDVNATLVGAYGFLPDNITLLVDGNASRGAILTAIAGLQQAVGADDEVFFFYSGHGAKSTPRLGPISEGIVLWGGADPQPYPECLWD